MGASPPRLEAARVELVKAQLRLEAVPQRERELAEVRAEVNQERTVRVAAAQAAAVASGRLEALEQRLAALQQVETELDEERQRRVAAEQAVAVAAGKLEAQTAPKPKAVRQGSIRAARQAHR